MNATIKTIIENRLAQEFKPMHLEVVDESWQHGGGAATESHFKVVVVSEIFDGLKLLARHRLVQATLSDVIKQIRALSLHTLTTNEWQKTGENRSSFRSPGCHNKT